MKFEEPDVRLDGLRLAGLGTRGGTVYAQLHIANPNGYRLEAASLSYDLELAEPSGTEDLDWVRFADGEYARTVSIEAHDSTVVEVPVDFTFEGVSGVARSVLQRGTLDYRVSGVIGVREPVRRDVPFRHAGKVSLSGVRLEGFELLRGSGHVR
jgi:LEA14-like dessication related protein